MLPWYATREQVKRAADSKLTARDDARVDAAVDAATRDVEGDLRRRFYPQDATYTFPAPCGRTLFLDNDLNVDLVSLTTLTVDGTAVAAADRDLLPVDGPPFTRIRFDTSISFGTDRRPVEGVGTWGFDNRTEAAGTLAAAVGDTSTTTVDVSDGSTIGVGSLLTVDTERLVVAERAMLATGHTLTAALTATVSNVTVTASGGTWFAGEVIQVDSERIFVVDVSGTTLTVKRAWDGTVLAAHSSGAAISAPRRLTVERGTTGTTAATHLNGAAVKLQLYPGPVVAYTVALALVQLLGETGGYGREIGPDGGEMTPGVGLAAKRDQARRGYQRLLLG